MNSKATSGGSETTTTQRTGKRARGGRESGDGGVGDTRPDTIPTKTGIAAAKPAAPSFLGGVACDDECQEERFRERIRALEAELALRDRQLDECVERCEKADARVAELEAEIERLKSEGIHMPRTWDEGPDERTEDC